MSVKPEFKIIADHLRSSCFLIADGVLPSNEGRGYVLRRIMRRGMRQLHKLGAKEATMYKLVDALIKEMGSAYPELERAKEVIVETLKNEEEKFRETLDKGLKLLDEALRSTQGNAKFSGRIAFKLYDTYGFPLDLTQDILKEKNIEVDVEEFNLEMEKQRNRGKENWSGSGEAKDDDLFFKLREKFGETKFLGYETTESKAKILAILENGIILDQTPFYATSGGQRGDDGIIKFGSKEIKIFETKKFAGNLFVHLFAQEEKNQKCDFKVGDEVEAIVNSKTRQMRAQNHSATHLLHKALKMVLGNSISQKGSNVDAPYFTFDFNFNRAMTAEEIKKVEDLANSYIKSGNVETKLMALDEARASGAEALFGEKYDSEVRVVKMGPSVELCGGTHVKNTSEIEIIKIISEKSVASGIRRIEARSGEEAKKYLAQKDAELQNSISDLIQKINQKNQEIIKLGGAAPGNIDSNEKDLEKLSQELKKREKEIERIKKQKLLEEIKNIKIENNFIHHKFNAIDAKDLREAASELGSKNSSLTFLTSENGESSLVAIFVPTNLKLNSNELMKKINAKGGGKPDLATGSMATKDVAQAVEILRNK
jgi:alanyl-tRNA synthetase